MTIPSASFRRRLGRAAVVASAIFSGTVALWACGPFLPRWLLGPERLLTPAPEGLIRQEIGRLQLAETPKAMPAEDPWQQTAEADLEDLKKALAADKRPAARREALVAQYAEVRNALAQFAASVTVFENISEPLWEEEGTEEGEPPVLPADLRVPEGLPGEFADYLRGALAYHRGDLDAAISAWEKLLKRPEGERRFRSTWAAFMLGKTHLRAGRPAEAVRWLARTREIAAQKEFADSLGLAAASLGWEGRAERDLGHHDKALVLYARQGRGDDFKGVSSLQFVARQALKAGPDALAPIARSAEARSVMTAFLVSDADAPWELWEIEEAEAAAGPDAPKVDPDVAAWLAALRKAGIKDVDGAERIAWAAYQGGDFSAARQWLDRAPADAPIALWVRAKLLLREGELAEAQKLLDRTAATMADPELSEDEIYMHSSGSAGGKLVTPTLAAGESAALLTTLGSYGDALDRFLRSGFWVDAAHLADRVLTIDELKSYVDSTWPADLARQRTEPEYYPYMEGLAPPEPAQVAHDIRYLLGRRLVRAGRSEEAKAYLPAYRGTHLENLIASLRQGQDATALFRAACITRKHGMELMGTELDPDWFLFEGQYDLQIYRDQLQGRARNPHLKPGPEELQKYERNLPDPDARFHYRYKAADLAWKAAALLPDGSDQKARILATAGSWLKARDPEAARPFYKALMECCGGTQLGQEAKRVRWFPEVPECEQE